MTPKKKKYFRVFRRGYKVHLCTRKKSDGRYHSLCGRNFWERGDLFIAQIEAFEGDECKRCQFCSKKWLYEWGGKTLMVRIAKRSN